MSATENTIPEGCPRQRPLTDRPKERHLREPKTGLHREFGNVLETHNQSEIAITFHHHNNTAFRRQVIVSDGIDRKRRLFHFPKVGNTVSVRYPGKSKHDQQVGGGKLYSAFSSQYKTYRMMFNLK